MCVQNPYRWRHSGDILAGGDSVAAFALVPDGKVTWNYEEGENGLFSASGAVVLTVAGDSEALPGTENGREGPRRWRCIRRKGRGTGGVRSQRFLKGRDGWILPRVRVQRIRCMLPRKVKNLWNCRS